MTAYLTLLVLTSALGGHLSAKAYPSHEYGSVAPMIVAVLAFLVLLNATVYFAQAAA